MSRILFNIKHIYIICVMSAVLFISESAFAQTGKIVVITEKGQVLKGGFIASLFQGEFFVKNRRLSCRGEYDSMSRDREISAVVRCSDGRKGIVFIKRDSTLQSGRGELLMSDGEEGKFLFGSEADAY